MIGSLQYNKALEYKKSTACGCQCLAVGHLIEDKISKPKEGHNSEEKMHFELCHLIV